MKRIEIRKKENLVIFVPLTAGGPRQKTARRFTAVSLHLWTRDGESWLRLWMARRSGMRVVEIVLHPTEAGVIRVGRVYVDGPRLTRERARLGGRKVPAFVGPYVGTRDATCDC